MVNIPRFISEEILKQKDDEDYFFFNEKLFPSDILNRLFEFLKSDKSIIDIKRNVFDGKEILTYLIVKQISTRNYYKFN